MISSIFNSEYLRTWRALPLGVHVWHAALGIGLVSVCIACNAALHAYQERTATKVKPLKIVENTGAIILGNSQYEALSDYTITGNPQELGLPGTGYTIQSEVFFAHANRLPNLRLLMLGFCNVMLNMPDVQNRAGDYDDVLVWGVPWYRLPGVSYAERLGIGATLLPGFGSLWRGPNLSYDEGIWAKALSGLSVSAAQDSTQTKLRPFTEFTYRGFQVSPGDGAEKMAAYQKSLSNSKQRESNLASFLRIIDYCDANGIDVALLRSPTTQAYWRARTKDWDEELLHLYQTVRQRYPKLKVMVWDAEHHLPMPDAWFYDGNHMHLAAHEEFVKYLNDRVSAWQAGAFPDDGIQSVIDRPEPFSFETTPLLQAIGNPWEAKGGAIVTACPVPPALAEFCADASRVTLPPRAEIYFQSSRGKLSTESVRGQAWISVEGEAPTSARLNFSIFDPAEPSAHKRLVDIRLLRPSPELLSATATSGETWESVTFKISNNADTPVSFILAGPRLDLYRSTSPTGI